MSEENEEVIAPTKSLFAAAPVADASTAEVAESTDIVEPVSSDTVSDEQPVEATETVTETETVEEATDTTEPTDAVQETPESVETTEVKEPETGSVEEEYSEEDISSAINQIAAVVKTYNIPVRRLVTALGGLPSTRKGIKAPILFKDNDGNTWSGRGRTPIWLRDKNPEDYRI